VHFLFCVQCEQSIFIHSNFGPDWIDPMNCASVLNVICDLLAFKYQYGNRFA